MPPRESRTYVDVVLRVDAMGVQTPLAVILPDRRTYPVDRVSDRRRIAEGLALTVHIGEHVTQLHRDDRGFSGQRWYVTMRSLRQR